MIYLKKVKSYFFSAQDRTLRANKNIFYSFFIKGISIASQFALVPLTLNYLDKTQYGIWLTLASIISWFSFFDIGIGNGLRNKLSEALAENNIKLAKIYVSTSYVLVAGIFFTLIIVFWHFNPFLNWSEILNTPMGLNLELSKMVLFVFIFFSLRFILALIGNILFAYQQSALNNLMSPLGNILSLLVIYTLTITTESSLFWVAVTFSATPVLILAIFNIVFFTGKFKIITPSLRYVDFKHSKDLLGLGFKFFVIQISVLILFSSSNIILIQLFGPEEVTVYNIAYKYFTVALMINGIITSTYWSAFTEAYIKKDIQWISASIRKLEKITFLLILLILVSVLVSEEAFDLWVGNSVHIPNSIKITMCLYAIISLISAPHNIFINGTGKITLQLYMAIFSIIVMLPLAILFSKMLYFGPSGVILALCITSLPGMVLYRFQYAKLISGKASGIWNK